MEKPRKNKCYHQTHDQKITERLIPPPPACLRTGITAPSQCSPLVPSLHETDVLFAVDVFRIDTTNFAAPITPMIIQKIFLSILTISFIFIVLLTCKKTHVVSLRAGNLHVDIEIVNLIPTYLSEGQEGQRGDAFEDREGDMKSMGVHTATAILYFGVLV
ncbi:hypothetical protein C4D60_Mb10t26990 [Musa balbisiana]|uniref:Uncharacterized protein n=1 Tax=Musa balbisiana TaxID=52838 RepID=A0A4V4H543_MUSBA|nr:hypothetical protein C4D60_Mb10t26990 [Musa balbisiana]